MANAYTVAADKSKMNLAWYLITDNSVTCLESDSNMNDIDMIMWTRNWYVVKSLFSYSYVSIWEDMVRYDLIWDSEHER